MQIGSSAPSRLLACRLTSFRDHNLIADIAITALGWVGFVTFYGYITPVAERTWVLVIVGLGLVICQPSGTLRSDARPARAARRQWDHGESAHAPDTRASARKRVVTFAR
jgi:predicted MFS family arabinose efflux permease